MGYQIYKFSNASDWGGETPTVSIQEGDEGWAEAYAEWLKGKNPTNSLEWKKGVIAHTKLKGNNDNRPSF